jgi:superfamily II DNA or RNA helicase
LVIKVYPHNEVQVRIEADDGDRMDLSEYFSFYVPNYQWSPKFRSSHWDGKIRLFDKRRGLLYKGLLDHLSKFCEDRKIELDDCLGETYNDYDMSTVDALYKYMKIPDTFEHREYQKKTILQCIRENRLLCLSPTASGKSFVIYALYNFYKKKTLIIVPTRGLIRQMGTDFVDYGFKDNAFIVDGEADKEIWHDNDIGVNVVISTWQSIVDMPPEWYDQFGLIIGDEAHLFKAKSLQKIMMNAKNTKYRFAFTGTLDESETHQFMIEALFGSTYDVISTKELIEKRYISPIQINVLVFKHDKNYIHKEWSEERRYLATHEMRNKYIYNLAEKCKENVLILYTLVDMHGKPLYNMINEMDRNVFFISGATKPDDREKIRHHMRETNDNILLASYGTFSTGVNVENLSHVLFASAYKSKIKVLQSIGRGLRKHQDKERLNVYDLADDLRKENHSEDNYTLAHLQERIRLYNEQMFDYKIYTINI